LERSVTWIHGAKILERSFTWIHGANILERPSPYGVKSVTLDITETALHLQEASRMTRVAVESAQASHATWCEGPRGRGRSMASREHEILFDRGAQVNNNKSCSLNY
jgi:hypothetical protein